MERCLELSKVAQPGRLMRSVPRPGAGRLEEEGKVKSRMLSARLRSSGMLHLDSKWIQRAANRPGGRRGKCGF